MRPQQIRGYIAIAAVLLPYAASLAQSVDVKQFASFKQVLPLAELDDSYMAIKASSTNAYDTGMVYYYSMLGMMFSDRSSTERDIVKFVDMLWTKGETVMFGGESYLTCYRIDFSELAASSGAREGAPTVEHLRLHLVRLSAISSLTPYADVSADDLRALFQKKAEDQPQQGSQPAAVSSAKQLGLGMLMYCSDYDDIAPYAQSTSTVQWVTYPYIKSLSIWNTGNPNGSRFLFNMALAGVNMTDIEDPADTLMFYESAPWPDRRRAVVFADGHGVLLTPEEWEEASKSLRLKIKKSAKPLPANYGVNEIKRELDRLGGT